MELTLDQALQNGVEAHKAGEVQEADRYYTAILKANPKHPDANHNMGVLAVDIGKVKEAIPFFETALEANPSISQFWLSYINALIKLNRIADAKAVFDQAKSKGAKGDGFDRLEQWINTTAAKKSNIQEPSQEQLQSLINLHMQGQFQEALNHALQLMEMFPNSINLYNIIGSVNHSLGQLEEAIEAYTKAFAIKSDFAEPHNNMGSALHEQGKLEEAIEAYKKAISIKPYYAEAHNNMGSALNEQGKLGEAIEAYKKALSIKPDFTEAYYNLGNSLNKQGKLEEAIEAYTKALSIKPDYAKAHNNLAITLHMQGKLKEAVEAYTKALSIKPDYFEAHNNMGNSLEEQGKLEEAIEAYKKAISIKPDYAEAYKNMGIALKDHGKLEKAVEAYSRALSIKPDYAEAHRHLSLIKKCTQDDEYFFEAQAMYKRKDLNHEARCHLNFALAKMYEDVGKLDQAYYHLSEGNAGRKKILKYSIDQDTKLFLNLKRTEPKLLKSKLEIDESVSGLSPIFILGMPRSGTTLVEQIVSSHSNVTGGGELRFVSYYGFQLATDPGFVSSSSISKFRTKYLSELSRISKGRHFITDKMPQNFRFIPLICAAFPDAKIIHVQRNAVAVCWSNFKQYFSTQDLGYCYNLMDIKAYYGLYKDLMKVWQSEYSDRIYNLDYEKLTTDQEKETRDLIAHLDLTWEAACLYPHKNERSVKTASQQQVRKKLYQGSSKGWLQYKPFLGSVFDELEKQLKPPPVKISKTANKHSNILNTIKLDQAIKLANKKVKDGLSEEAKKIYQDIINKFPQNKKALHGIKKLASKTSANISDIHEPSQEQLQSLINLHMQGQFQEALNHALQSLEQFPNSVNLHNIIGAQNRGLGKLEEAIEAYKKAISIKPDFAQAYYNMANAFKEQGKLEEAIEAYSRALSIKPGYAEAYYNIGIALRAVSFTKPNRDLHSTITALLDRKKYIKPIDISRVVIHLLKLEPQLKKQIQLTYEDLNQNPLNVISNLCFFPLLLKLMSVCPLPDLDLEELFKNLRRSIIENISSLTDASPEFLRFQSALALQCFTNEYVYNNTAEEEKALQSLEKIVKNVFKNNKQPSPQAILALASYKALNEYEWCKLLVATDKIKEVYNRQVTEPDQERKLKKQLPILAEITDQVSSKVRAQYEESPYPRWVNLGLPLQPMPISNVADAVKLKLFENRITEIQNPEILIAGCGTGQHSIGNAKRFKFSKVLAIDLSLSSLAYAKRKTDELKIENIDYMQADILDLAKLDRQFDIIESVGVLHHMDNPMSGWKVITDCLKPGGLMKIGLYSELARQNIVKIREEIKQRNTVSSDAEMRSFRNMIMKSDKDHHSQVLRFRDFYSLSELRDLLFHVQEHRFTIPKIKDHLDKLGLKFCGFEASQIVSHFQQTNTDNNDPYDLDKWQAYEEANQKAFSGMYLFWCQKVD